MSGVVLSVEDLTVEYASANGPVRAVDGVSFELSRGEVLGIAGESGCGKSTLAHAITRLLRPPGTITGGAVHFHDAQQPGGQVVDVLGLDGEPLRLFRWQKIAMVFQSAMNALNPVLNVRRQLEDVLIDHEPGRSRAWRRARCCELLELVGIDVDRLSAYPHQLSGGMRQRVMIAMALALRPDVIVMDEPTTALDVVVQREILDEINLLREQFGFAVVLITHDLSLLLEISDRIAVMYGGRIVEYGPTAGMLDAPRHPYTVGLTGSFPDLLGDRRPLAGIPGSPPDLSQPIEGCSFAPRCGYAFAPCAAASPPLRAPATAPSADRRMTVACHLYDPAEAPNGPPDALGKSLFNLTEVPQ